MGIANFIESSIVNTYIYTQSTHSNYSLNLKPLSLLKNSELITRIDWTTR